MPNSLIQFYHSLDYKPDILLFPFALFLPLFPSVAQVCFGLYIVLWASK